MITKIFFVRHGEVNNPDKVMYGRLPGFPLSQNGKNQIAKTAKFLSKENIDIIYSSPLLRTKQSAKIISNILCLPINYSDYLLEVDTPMVGKSMNYVHENTINYNVFATKENKFGETIQDVARRMQKFIDEIRGAHAGENVVAITHGDPIMIVKAIMEDLPLMIDSLRPINTKGYIGHGEVYTAEFNSR
jgi:broad specificity phosphatase PhoE